MVDEAPPAVISVFPPVSIESATALKATRLLLTTKGEGRERECVFSARRSVPLPKGVDIAHLCLGFQSEDVPMESLGTKLVRIAGFDGSERDVEHHIGFQVLYQLDRLLNLGMSFFCSPTETGG